MATFSIPRTRVQYEGHEINEPYFSAYWGATITGDYVSNPYRFRITNISLSGYHKCNSLPSGAAGYISAVSSLGVRVYSYDYNGNMTSSQYFQLGAISSGSGYVSPGETKSFSGAWSGSRDLTLNSNGGRIRVLLFLDGYDYGMIYSSGGYPTDYVPVNPDISINTQSLNVNNIRASLNSYVLTDLSSYSFRFDIYSDSGRTNLVHTYTGSDIGNFPLDWNGATPGTTYYWKLNVSGVNSRTGGTVSMAEKTGTVNTQTPWINTESMTWTAAPLYNNHWTPRTVITYSLTESIAVDSADGLTFKNYEIQTALNGLNNNTKSHRVTARNGTISLTDTSKWLRECKPRDLAYIKVRVCCTDNAGREYFSNWFGITTAQYIYNKFHVYISRPSTAEQLRVNSRAQFNGNNTEKYWNKGEVR